MKEKEDKAESAQRIEKTLSELIKAVYMIGVIVFVAYFVFFTFFQDARISTDPGDWGTLGDYFGGLLNPVISFATLMVAYAVWKQQKDELRQTKEALEEQARTAEQQRQEQRFFDLLTVYYRTVESIQLGMPPIWKHESIVPVSDHFGKAAIQSWFENRATQLWDLNKNFGDNVPELTDKQYLLGFLEHDWYHEHGAQFFGAYLRTIESILNTASLVLKGNQGMYVQLFRSQLSQSELVLIGVFLLLGDATSLRLKELSEQFGLLSQIADCDLKTLLQTHLPAVVIVPNLA